MENNILKLLKKIKDNGIYWLIVLQPILDIIAYFQNDQGMSVAGYIRLMITCTLPLYALVKTKKRKNDKQNEKFPPKSAFPHLFYSLPKKNG